MFFAVFTQSTDPWSLVKRANALQVVRFAPDSRWIVMHVNIKPGRPEDRSDRTDETVKEVETCDFGSYLNTAVVIGRKDL